METRGIIYVLTNEAMPGLVKIGKTTQADVKLRMNQLYSTGVPVSFRCEYAVEVDDYTKVENALAIAFDEYRPNPKREFYRIKPEQPVAILELLKRKDVTPSVKSGLASNLSQAEKDSAKNFNRRPNLNFLELNINPGSVLRYLKDEAIEVQVADDRNVIYNGKTVSLTDATKTIMGINYDVRPSPYWIFEGRLLKRIYDEFHSVDPANDQVDPAD